MRILTTDIYEGAYLLSEGMELKNIWEDKTKRKRSVVFEFNGNNIEVLKSAYLRGRARANVLKFKNSVNELKDIMFNLIRDNELRLKKGERENEVHRIPVARAQK